VNDTDDYPADEGQTENAPSSDESDIPMRPDDKRYSNEHEAELKEAITTAYHARRRGKDPDSVIEMSFAEEMPDRVENILGIAGVANRIRELESDYTREEVASNSLRISLKVGLGIMIIRRRRLRAQSGRLLRY